MESACPGFVAGPQAVVGGPARVPSSNRWNARQLADRGGGTIKTLKPAKASAWPRESIRTETVLLPFLYAFMAGHFIVAVPIRATHLTSDPLLLGMIGTTLQAALVVFSFVCGRISDSIARWKMLAIAPLLGGALILMISAAVSIHQLIILSGLLGIAGAVFWPSLEASIADRASGQQLASSLSIFNLSASAGYASGSFLASVLIGLGILVPLLGGGVFGLLLGIGILWHYAMSEAVRSTGHATDACVSGEEYDPRPRRFLLLARIGSFGVYFSTASVCWLFPKLGINIGLSSQNIASLVAIMMGVQALAFFAMGRIRQWQFSSLPLLTVPAFAFGGLFLTAGGSSMPTLSVGFSLLGACSGVFYTTALFYGLQAPNRKGANAGIHETVIASGGLVGPLLGGYVARLLDLRAPLYLAMGVVSLTALLQAGIWTRHVSRTGTRSPAIPRGTRWRM